MTSWIKVARYHLLERRLYVWSPWAIVALTFAVNLIITALQGGPNPTKALIAIYAAYLFVGVLSISRLLPFGLALGVSRRSYYAGTVLLAVTLASLNALALALLQEVERATNGWGVNLSYFRLDYLFAGPWYLTWLTSFVGLVLVFIYGMCLGIVYRRWNLLGVVIFLAAQGSVLLAGGLVAGRANAWDSIGHFFTQLGAAGLTGLLAAFAAVLLVGGYGIVRRVTV